jgi:hypothetical protein
MLNELEEKIRALAEKKGLPVTAFERMHGFRKNAVRLVVKKLREKQPINILEELAKNCRCSVEELSQFKELSLRDTELEAEWNPWIHRASIQMLLGLEREKKTMLVASEAFSILRASCASACKPMQSSSLETQAPPAPRKQEISPRTGRPKKIPLDAFGKPLY